MRARVTNIKRREVRLPLRHPPSASTTTVLARRSPPLKRLRCLAYNTVITTARASLVRDARARFRPSNLVHRQSMSEQRQRMGSSADDHEVEQIVVHGVLFTLSAGLFPRVLWNCAAFSITNQFEVNDFTVCMQGQDRLLPIHVD